ncbi:MAG: molybdopterin molybdotransferase MoeA [Porticoccaceae bacterium]|nr:molybdopterin molybdotransferase MoeA [Porticoccaceae bacterium]
MISFSLAQSKLKALCDSWIKDVGLESESRFLSESLGFYLSQDVCAKQNLPRENLSAMDGYALCFSDGSLQAKEHEIFTICGESRAGKPYLGKPLKANNCLRIMTGAVVPDWVDTVIIQENTQKIADNKISLLKQVSNGRNIRWLGEEIRQGQKLFDQYQPVTPNVVSVLASQGMDKVDAYRKLRIGFFATGDELRMAGESLASGEIYESNLSAIAALLQGLPVECTNLGVIKDSMDDIEQCLKQAAQQFDVVISSGGVSVGDYDFVKGCVESMGILEIYKVAIKPGKPLCFGVLGNEVPNSALFFGLPGNAVSSFVALTEFFMPAIRFLLGGRSSPQKLYLMATLDNGIQKSSGRMEFQRGILTSQVSPQGDISWHVSTLNQQQSHRVYGLARANCTVILAEDSGNIEAGNRVRVAPFPWCFNGMVL